jgi:hypothetical protein
MAQFAQTRRLHLELRSQNQLQGSEPATAPPAQHQGLTAVTTHRSQTDSICR